MMDSTADEGDFPPNPFRSGPPQQQQQQQQQQPPPLPLQQPPQPQVSAGAEEDFFTNQTTTSMSDPLSVPSPMDSNVNYNVNTNNNNVNIGGNTMNAPTAPRSWWQSCRACCTMQTYQRYFDVDTVDVSNRLKAGVTTFYQPDVFRTDVVGIERNDAVKGPDLYGPFWITATLVFLLAVTSNIAAYLHSDNIEEFEYDIEHLIRATTVLTTFVFGVPTVFWLLTQCLGMQALLLVEWICLYGYSMVIFLPATLLCLIPLTVTVWIFLALATAVSMILVLRNVAGPLLATDVSQNKAGPILLAVMGAHVILLLILKVFFYKK